MRPCSAGSPSRPLVVLCRRSADDVAAVGQREQRELRASSSSSITSAPGHGPERGVELRMLAADEHALAGGEAVRLHDARWPRDRHRLGGRLRPLAHHLLREGLSSPRSAPRLRSGRRRRSRSGADDRRPQRRAAPRARSPRGRSRVTPRATAALRRRPRGPGGTSLARRCPDCPALRGARSRSGSGRASRRAHAPAPGSDHEHLHAASLRTEAVA